MKEWRFYRLSLARLGGRVHGECTFPEGDPGATLCGQTLDDCEGILDDESIAHADVCEECATFPVMDRYLYPNKPRPKPTGLFAVQVFHVSPDPRDVRRVREQIGQCRNEDYVRLACHCPKHGGFGDYDDCVTCEDEFQRSCDLR